MGGKVTLSNIPKGTCVLIMDPSPSATAMNAPAVFEFPNDKGSSPSITLKYRRLQDPSRLVTLPGYKVETFIAGLDQPRQMVTNDDGTLLFVGTSAIRTWVDNARHASIIYAIELDPETGVPGKVHVVDAGLEEPHGVAYRDGTLYYSTVGALYRIRDIDTVYKGGLVAQRDEVLKFPADDVKFPLLKEARDGDTAREQHQKHPLFFNPYNKDDPSLYTAVGIPCNVCRVPKDDRYGTIMKIDVEKKTFTLLAHGVRNAGGYDWNPQDGKIWFTDNNRQGTSVDTVVNGDELNVIDGTALKHYGAPYVFGTTVPGYTPKEYDARANLPTLAIPRGAQLGDIKPGEISARPYVKPVHIFQPGAAPIGTRFWKSHPAEDGGQRLLVALHGSGISGRRAQTLATVSVNGVKVNSVMPLVTGFRLREDGSDAMCLGTEGCIGRPTDLYEMKDGSMLVSDDVSGVIYRITYSDVGLPDTALTVAMPAPPESAVSAELIQATLVDSAGKARELSIPWSGKASIKGLPVGDYEVTLGRTAAGGWVPESRTNTIALVAGTPTTLVAKYKKRPENLEVPLELTAPEKPQGALSSAWNVVVRSDDGTEQAKSIPWGDKGSVTLDYGTHTILYPYTEKAYPKLDKESVEVEDEDASFTKTMEYVAVDNLGKHMLTEGPCASCHSTGDWSNGTVDPFKWDAVQAQRGLQAKISSMNVPGHCDTVCQDEIASYLFNDVWKDKLVGSERGPRQMHMLSASDLVYTIRDIFGVAVSLDDVPADMVNADGMFFYESESADSIITSSRARKYYGVAMNVMSQLDEDELKSKFGTDAAGYVGALGKLLFRRSLTPSEVQRYSAIFDAAPAESARNTAVSMMMSPHFIYRSELGAKAGVDGDFELTGPERATLLAYSIWGTTPDASLIDLGESGGLSTKAAVKTKALEMMKDPRAAEQMAKFVSYYIAVPASQKVSPKEGLSDELINAMRQEIALTVKDVYQNADDADDEKSASIYRIFNPGFTFTNKDLAAHYGLSGGGTGTDLVKTPLTGDAAKRWGGPLNTGLFAVANSGEETSVIMRGFRIRQNMYCQSFKGNAEREGGNNFPTDRPISQREYWDVVNGPTAAEGKCWTCHKYFNDTGAAMESYGPTGQYRTEERGWNVGYRDQKVAIRTDGPFIDDKGSAVPWIDHMQDVRDIAQHVGAHVTPLQCLAQGYYRFTMGARMDGDSYAEVKRMAEKLASRGSRFKDMFAETLSSDTYLVRKERRKQESTR